MPNSRHYTSNEVKNLFDYAFEKIDFIKAEGLTRDTGCTRDIEHTNDEYIKSVIQKITGTETEKDTLKNTHNSHDWVKIIKHVFQNSQIINFQNINIFKEWKEFSTYSRKAFAEKENIEKSKEYVSELKKFMAKLINHGAVEEVNCIHNTLHLAYKVFTNDTTKVNTSEKVANMLGGMFYDALQLEGIVKSFTMFQLDGIQVEEYVQRVRQCSSFLKEIIEDPLFSNAFKKTDYAQYLIIPKLEKETDSEKKYTRVKRSLSLENTSTLDPDFIEEFKKLSIMNVSKSAPELSSSKKNTEVTFSYTSGQKVAPNFKEMNIPLETQPNDMAETHQTKTKKRLSLSVFIK